MSIDVVLLLFGFALLSVAVSAGCAWIAIGRLSNRVAELKAAVDTLVFRVSELDDPFGPHRRGEL